MTRTIEDLSGWTPRLPPPRTPMEGRLVRLEPFDVAAHARGLFEAYQRDRDGDLWTYMPYGPFADFDAYEAHCKAVMTGDDPLFFTVLDKAADRPVGVASFMRINPAHGVIETGSICYSPLLQRTPGATETMYLFARRAFDELGYRRYEWKCDNNNAPSKRAALRLGFRYEGLFRKHMVIKGRNRDTAWFAITDDEWPRVKAAHGRWLDPENFTADGTQRLTLSALNAADLTAGKTTLRRADMADLEPVVALQRAAYAANREILGAEPIPLQWDYKTVLAEQEVWLRQAESELAGVLILTPVTGEYVGAHLYVDSIGVAPKHAGYGIGNHLLDAAIARARALGLPELRLLTGEPLVDNVNWYRRRGFETVEIEALEDRRVVHMRLPVA